MASIAVLPILIGLGVDYGIQFQARAQEARRIAEDEGEGPLTAEMAVSRAAGRAAPTIATAALATATGFLVLLLSPVPMVQGFGLLLVAGIAVALGCALTAGSAALVPLADPACAEPTARRHPGALESGARSAPGSGAGMAAATARRGGARSCAPWR